MLKSLGLRGVGPTTALDIEFAPRLNLITGDNGLGKSFLLDVSWWVLTGSWSGPMAMPRQERWSGPEIQAVFTGLERHPEEEEKPRPFSRRFKFQPFGPRWVPKDSREPTWSMTRGPSVPSETLTMAPVIYARIDGGFSVWDPSRNLREHDAPLSFGRVGAVPEAFHFTQETLWNGLKLEDKPVCNGLLQDWVLWQQGSDDADRLNFAMLTRALEVLSPPEGPIRPGAPVRFLNDARRFPTLELDYDTIPLIHASAGMKRILSLAYALIWTWSEHLVACQLLNTRPARSITLIVDEVESHLHPQWQRAILKALITVVQTITGASDTATQLLVVTHSPLILASVEPWFDAEQDRLWTFDLEGREVKLKQVDFVKRGKADLWLTSEVFDLKEPRSLEAEQAIERARRLLEAPQADRAEIARVDEALRAVLSDIDGFWTRWRYFVERQEAAG